MSGVVLRSAVEMLAMLRARKISSLELAEEHIRQIDRLNPRLTNPLIRTVTENSFFPFKASVLPQLH
jgi:Asp-tRNA(Asn)/Glu-tRNA(Gln) amidotransferase A subunit family amidase